MGQCHTRGDGTGFELPLHRQAVVQGNPCRRGARGPQPAGMSDQFARHRADLGRGGTLVTPGIDEAAMFQFLARPMSPPEPENIGKFEFGARKNIQELKVESLKDVPTGIETTPKFPKYCVVTEFIPPKVIKPLAVG